MHVIAPDRAGTTGGSSAGTKIESTVAPEKHIPFYKRRIAKIGAGVLAVTAAAATTFAMLLPKGEAIDTTDPNIDKGTSVTQIEEGNNPDVVEAPVKNPLLGEGQQNVEQYVAYPENEPLPAELEKYKTMPIEEFTVLPKSEQALYASWLLRHLDTFVGEYENQLGNRFDAATEKLVSKSTQNTAQEALASAQWIQRVARSFDSEDAKKLAVAGIWNPQQNPELSNLIAQAEVAEVPPRAMAEGNMIPIVPITESSELISDIDGSYHYEITAADGAVDGSVYYAEYTDYKGEPIGIWMLSYN